MKQTNNMSGICCMSEGALVGLWGTHTALLFEGK